MLASIINSKCPRCHKGDLFVEKNPYKFRYLTKMPVSCNKCGQLTEPEPGFYYGAMYISYGLCTLVFFLNFILFELVFPLPGYWFLALNSVVLLVLWPIIFRMARVIYLNIFVKYDPKALEKAKNIQGANS